jgi:prepilin-type N-terminal cleavage/methylation domain-containing protein
MTTVERLKIPERGFTLVEVMVSTAILSLGVVFIFEAFFASLNSYNYYSTYLKFAPWMDEKIWEMQEALTHSGSAGGIATVGEFAQDNRKYIWNLNYHLIDRVASLYEINLTLSSPSGRRDKRLSRAAYAAYQEAE